MRQAIEWEDRTLRRIPLVRTLYSSIKDMGQYFKRDRRSDMGRCVLITLPGTGVQLLGFVTKEDGGNLKECQLVDDPVLVYLPMSYQIGGFMAVVPRSAIEAMDVPFDEAMTFIFMAGMKNLQEDQNPDSPPSHPSSSGHADAAGNPRDWRSPTSPNSSA